MTKIGRAAPATALLNLSKSAPLGALLLSAALLTACTPDANQPEFTPYSPRDQAFRDKYGTITGSDGISLLSSGRRSDGEDAGAGGGGIGVNAYLWRGAIETIDFIPLMSADPFGGLILTDWYQPAQSPDERLKLQVLIRDTVLRADGVKVTVLRQERSARGDWLDAAVDRRTETEIEDKILTRARELRIAGLPG